jgi:class 3 adenylate cyclase
VGKANVSRQSLVEAIATLEAQRGLTGDSRNLDQAVETALQALRDRLARLQAGPGDGRRHQLAVLVADLSGFTALSEHMDVERVREAINAMWRVLDDVIRAWGGQIDQHAGDSLLALFGLPQPRQGDTARALHAALAMQQELDLFNARARRAAAQTSDASSWAGEWPGPDMRIGVHSGPVYFARAPVGALSAGVRSSAVGDTVAEARRLEKLAPTGGVLASTAVQRQSEARFTFRPMSEIAPQANREESFLVIGERTESTAYVPGTVAGQVTRLVGRTEEMDRLELALQVTADSRAPQLVTVVGPPGIGKSRLIHEFESHVHLLSGSPVLLRAGTRGACPDAPFALVRDLLLRRFDIRPQHSHYLIEHRLRQALAELERSEGNREPWGHAATPAQALSLLERLLSVGKAAETTIDEVAAVAGPLIRAITAERPAIVILEGINRADRESLDLVDRLVREGDVGPVLFLGVATSLASGPSMQTIPWLDQEEDVFSPFSRIDLPPLSAVESRLMATGILSPLLPPPMRLLDLVVAEASGRPLYIENIIRLLIGRGVITVGERWRVDMARAEAFPLPSDLPKLMDVRLTQLPEVEQTILQHAAILGPLCWDTALIEMKTPADFDETEIEAALLSLEIKNYLVRDDIYSFAGNQAYSFRRDSVREAAYAGMPPAARRALHLEAAHWLIAKRIDARFSAWFPVDMMIAGHFEAAGDDTRAATWRQRAGQLAAVS